MRKWPVYNRALNTLGLVFLILTASQAQTSLEKGNIPLRNFTIKEYGGTAINNCIVEDISGVIYIANNKGVLIYDGLSWRTVKIANDDHVFSLGINNKGVIFVGGQDQLGYLWPDSIGNLEYRSLLDRLPDAASCISTGPDVSDPSPLAGPHH